MRVGVAPARQGTTHTGASCRCSARYILLAARTLGLGATLTTLYLQFEREAEAAMGLPLAEQLLAYKSGYGFDTGSAGDGAGMQASSELARCIHTHCCQSVIRWGGSARFAVARSTMWSMRIGGGAPIAGAERAAACCKPASRA